MNETLVLVGMLDSPFVRRVAVTLQRAGIAYENLALATFEHADRFARYSPLKRAPTLVLENGEPLFDSHLILEYLAERFPAVAALVPTEPSQRLRCQQVMGVATGLADKALGGVYELVFHAPGAPVLMARIAGQLADSLAWLEQRAPERAFLFGAAPSQADITVGATLCFAREAHPALTAMHTFPRVAAWCDRIDALPEFQATYLPLEPPRSSA